MDSPLVAASSSSVNPQKKSNKKVPIEEIFTHLKLSKSVYGSRRTVSLGSRFFFYKKKTVWNWVQWLSLSRQNFPDKGLKPPGSENTPPPHPLAQGRNLAPNPLNTLFFAAPSARFPIFSQRLRRWFFFTMKINDLNETHSITLAFRRAVSLPDRSLSGASLGPLFNLRVGFYPGSVPEFIPRSLFLS